MTDLFPKSVDNILDDDERKTPQHAALRKMKDEARRLEDEKLNEEAHLKYEELLTMNSPTSSLLPHRSTTLILLLSSLLT
jgi:hypothetical protein